MASPKIISIKKYESNNQYKVRWSYPLRGERKIVITTFIYYNTGHGKRFQKRGGPALPERLYAIMDKRISGGEFDLVPTRKKSNKLKDNGIIQRGAHGNKVRQDKTMG